MLMILGPAQSGKTLILTKLADSDRWTPNITSDAHAKPAWEDSYDGHVSVKSYKYKSHFESASSKEKIDTKENTSNFSFVCSLHSFNIII